MFLEIRTSTEKPQKDGTMRTVTKWRHGIRITPNEVIALGVTGLLEKARDVFGKRYGKMARTYFADYRLKDEYQPSGEDGMFFGVPGSYRGNGWERSSLAFAG